MDDVPPLEDVPQFLEKIKHEEESKTTSVKEKVELLTPIKETRYGNSCKQNATKSSGFGGMKKGFLFGGASSKASKDQKVKMRRKETSGTHSASTERKAEATEDIPVIRAEPAKSSLVIKEVQQAMAAESKKAQDFQDQLTKRLEANSNVNEVLSDPAWIHILDEFQRDPEAAMLKYKDDKEIKNTMLELCNVLGDTFLHMGRNNVSEEESLCNKLLDQPQVKEALTDPLIQQIMKHMDVGANDKVQRCIQQANPSQKRHIQTLIDFGLLTFAT